MATKLLTAFYTVNGLPTTGLTPVVNIFELDPLSNTQVVTNGATTEIGGGWYRYDFTTYNSTKSYVYTFDAGAGLTNAERYKIGGNESYTEDVAFGVWEESTLSHLTADTMGFTLVQTKSDTSSVQISQTTLITLVNTLLKYERNRTKIDTTQATLTIYDNDGVTPLTVFNLKDHLGNPSIQEVCERAPV